MKIHSLLLAGLSAATLASLPATAAAQDSSLAFNVGAVSDYRYRGISQTRLKPAVQGGIDYSLGGFYLGAWASTIKWIKDGGGNSSLELDLYGGYKGELTKGVNFDVGFLRYQYPSHKLAVSPNTNEVYGALSFGPVTAKMSYATSNLFGFADSKGSIYLDLTANFEVGGFTLTPHIGGQRVKRNTSFSYKDWSLGVSKDFSGVLVSATLVGTDTDNYVGMGKNLGKTGLVLGAKYSF
jgi:uncharacterized protein (TIGR02001 family)